MDLVKCPYTGFQGYEFLVDCKCRCHTPGYVQTGFMFAPCCNCSNNGRGAKPDKVKIYLYPLDQFEPGVKKTRANFSNSYNYIKHQYLPLLDEI